MKKVGFFHVSAIHRKGVVGPSICNYIFKITIFFEYVKFEAISWKIDILSITPNLKLEFFFIISRLCDVYDSDFLLHNTFYFNIIIVIEYQ